MSFLLKMMLGSYVSGFFWNAIQKIPFAYNQWYRDLDILEACNTNYLWDRFSECDEVKRRHDGKNVFVHVVNTTLTSMPWCGIVGCEVFPTVAYELKMIFYLVVGAIFLPTFLQIFTTQFRRRRRLLNVLNRG